MIGVASDTTSNPNYLTNRTPNGLATLTFTNCVLAGVNPSGSGGSAYTVPGGPRTLVYVVKFNDTAGAHQDYIYAAGNGTPGQGVELQRVGTQMYYWNGSHNIGPASITTNWYVMTVLIEDNNVVIRTNGADYYSVNPGAVRNSGSGGLYIGAEPANTTFRLWGFISRFWMWNKVLSAGEITQVEASCVSDYGPF